MSQNQLLTQSLLELSEAIKKLADVLSIQSKADNEIHIRQFALIVNRFSQTAGQLQQPANLTNESVKKKHEKGYIVKWLKQKNIISVDSVDNLKADEYLHQAVDYLAEHYNHLKDFYKQLKYQQNIRKNFTHKTTQQSINYIQKWCNMLQQHQLIDRFELPNDSEIFVDIAEVHTATNFIYGYWLEVLLRREIAQWMHKNLDKIHSFDIVSQAHILKPDRTKSEIDLLLMLNQRIYWFECKSGIIKEYYAKFNEHRNLFHLNEKQSFLVIPHKDSNIALEARKRADMTTLFGTELELQLEESIQF